MGKEHLRMVEVARLGGETVSEKSERIEAERRAVVLRSTVRKAVMYTIGGWFIVVALMAGALFLAGVLSW